MYFKAVDSSFPSESKEETGYIVGISEHCGPALKWKILTADTNKIIYCSQVQSISDADPNIHADMFGGEDDTPSHDPIIKSHHVSGESKQEVTTPAKDGEADSNTTPIFNPEDLVGRTFLMDQQEDGQ